ncbi:MAG: hypothetical protein CFH31_00659 [Alphaproteobacteria bacterium MarineAlpha9_Bin1]|nr:MAG: hypothetical protein CFH31_00659 [Alphaproteobacteria bacterium MarineAlpha9_Bin1]
MIAIDVRSNVKNVKKNLGFFAKKQIPKATSMALNKTATSLRGFTVREGKKEMGASEVKAITGHVTDSMVGHYSEEVDKTNLAYAAIDKFIKQKPNLRLIS